MLNSRETELSVLGSIMYSPELFLKTALEPEDFFYPENAQVFSAMEELAAAGQDINIKTVWNLIYRRGYSGISEAEIEDMLHYRVDKSVFTSFVAQLSEFSGFRLLEGGLKKIDSAMRKQDASLTDYTNMLGSLVQQVNSKDFRSEFSTGEALIDSYMEMVTRERSTLKFSGLETIDTHLVDFDAKEIIYIAARPSVGKTAFMLQGARTNLEEGARVGFLSMEMSVAKLMNRLISSRTGINAEELIKQRGGVTDEVREALTWFRDAPLFIDDHGPFTRDSVLQKVRKLVYEHGCDVVYIDYIGLIEGRPGVSRNEQLSDVSRSLKGIASELDIPLVIASQLSRDVVKRGGIPNLADLRDSGSLEQDGSIVAFLYHDIDAIGNVGNLDEYLKTQTDLPTKFKVDKQRNGPTFVRSLTFHKTRGVFTSREDDLATY